MKVPVIPPQICGILDLTFRDGERSMLRPGVSLLRLRVPERGVVLREQRRVQLRVAVRGGGVADRVAGEVGDLSGELRLIRGISDAF